MPGYAGSRPSLLGRAFFRRRGLPLELIRVAQLHARDVDDLLRVASYVGCGLEDGGEHRLVETLNSKRFKELGWLDGIQRHYGVGGIGIRDVFTMELGEHHIHYYCGSNEPDRVRSLVVTSVEGEHSLTEDLYSNVKDFLQSQGVGDALNKMWRAQPR